MSPAGMNLCQDCDAIAIRPGRLRCSACSTARRRKNTKRLWVASRTAKRKARRSERIRAAVAAELALESRSAANLVGEMPTPELQVA